MCHMCEGARSCVTCVKELYHVHICDGAVMCHICEGTRSCVTCVMELSFVTCVMELSCVTRVKG